MICIIAKKMKKTGKRIKSGLIEKKNVVLIWGKKVKILNQNINTDKLEILKKVREAGINTPKIYEKFEDIDKFPVVGRNYHHFGAKDFVLIKSPSEYVKRDYYLEYIRKIGEYRIHYCLGHYYPCKKIKKYPEANPIVRNHKNGWKFVSYNGKYKDMLVEFAKKIINIVKYDFGAIDCIMDKNHKLYFLEINSAPGLDNKRLNWYLEILKKEV